MELLLQNAKSIYVTISLNDWSKSSMWLLIFFIFTFIRRFKALTREREIVEGRDNEAFLNVIQGRRLLAMQILCVDSEKIETQMVKERNK